MSKKCEHCGAPINEGDRFCPYCGSPVSADASPYSKEGEFFAPQSGSYTSAGSSSGSDPFSNTDEKTGQVFNSIGTENSGEEASLGLKIVAFLFPFIGLIIYLINRGKAPSVAKTLLPWVIAGIVKNVVMSSIDGSYSSLSTIGQIGKAIRFIS